MNHTTKCNWKVTFYKNFDVIKSFTIENRTETEAFREAASEYGKEEGKLCNDWTMERTSWQ